MALLKNERRLMTRRNFSSFMQVTNVRTGKVLGNLVDVSTGGFKLDGPMPIPSNMDFRLRIEVSDEIAPQDHVNFGARCRWCKRDKDRPDMYSIGFQITSITSADLEIMTKMFERFGTPSPGNAPVDED
jgi:hypothetical protein